MSKDGVFSGLYFPVFRDTLHLSVFSPNAEKYGQEKTPYLDTFHAVDPISTVGSEVFKSPIWDTWTICNLDSIETNTGIQQREYFKCEAWLLIWFKEVQYGHTSHNTPIYLFKVITTTSAFFYFLWRCCVDLEQINTCWESNVWREESLTRVQILQCLRGHALPPCRRQYIDSSAANITHCIWLSKPRASHLLTKYSTQPLLIRILMMPQF